MHYDPERIQEALQAQGRSQVWLADVTGYNPSTVSQILNGHMPMTAKFATVAARFLGIPVAWLEMTEPAEAVAA